MSDRSGGSKGKKRRDYLITLDMAKELAMLENNEVGTKTRRYFIQCEKDPFGSGDEMRELVEKLHYVE